MKRTRYFTPQEANDILPDMARQVEKIDTIIEQAEQLAVSLGTESGEVVDTVRDDIEAIVAGIRDQGIEVKGLSPLLLDFPALMNGQEVFLCWRHGEDLVEHWHPVATGFSDRRHINERTNATWEWYN